MQQAKDKWIEEVLNSTAGMRSATPPVGRFEQIRDKAYGLARASRTIPLTTLSAAAACLLILIALNFTLLDRYGPSAEGEVVNTEASVQDIVDYYELGSNSTSL
jgi:hypothetical protein